jgi:NAD(P)-dependent dehydrogenase (short-subunit alcohol dehydrogenase family)
MQGKVAIVTGAAGGIGEAIVRKLGAKGVKVLGTGRNAGKLGALKDALAGTMEFDFVATDITADDAPKAIVDGAMDKIGRLDIVINNDGSFNFGPVDQTTDAMLDEVLGISMRAPFRLCREALTKIGEGGSFLFIGSTWGIYGTPGGGAYSVVKAGQIGLTQTMAAEYGPRGVRVNCVATGMIATEKARKGWEKSGFDAMAACQSFPLRRPGEPLEVAQAVVFLASDAASYITGETLTVGGGPQIKGMVEVD